MLEILVALALGFLAGSEFGLWQARKITDRVVARVKVGA